MFQQKQKNTTDLIRHELVLDSNWTIKMRKTLSYLHKKINSYSCQNK